VPWIFLAPALLAYVTMMIGPSAAGAAYAFTDWNQLGGAVHFIGLGNFRSLLHDSVAVAALEHTAYLAIVVVVVQNLAGLGLALGLRRALKSRGILRVVFFAPAVMSSIAVAYIWQYIYDPSGALNTALGDLGLGALNHTWLGDPRVALWAIAATVIWQWTGYSMVIYLAGLESVPAELEEAAVLDGAGAIHRFWYVTWPLLAPATTISVVLSSILSLTLFDQVFAMTSGGPGVATQTVSTDMYQEAFVYGHFAYGTALALLLTLMVASMVALMLMGLRRREAAMA
jgi:raffinose/stachyose/melibiose transport system permease protein